MTHPEFPAGAIQGFRFFWAFYVNGFRPETHCQPCFKGRRVDEFCTGRAENGRTYEFDAMGQFPYIYVCGVGSGPKSSLGGKNFHLPLRYEAGATVTADTYNGYSVTAHDAVALPIPRLELGWNGRDKETTQCRNFQFGVAYFGYPPVNCR